MSSPTKSPTEREAATKRDRFRWRIFDALYCADYETGGLADRLMAMIELAIRRQFKLTGAEFDLTFADLTRDILDLLDEKLAGAIDHDAAVDGLVEEFLGTEQLSSNQPSEEKEPNNVNRSVS